MAELPSGTVTFLFTDIEGSTRLWEEHADAMRGALARHDELVGEAIEAYGGSVVKTTGDGFHAVFASAQDAARAALAAQLAIEREPWSEAARLRVRMGLYTGEAQQRSGDYYGSAPNRGARLMSSAHGGQIVVCDVTATLVGDEPPNGVELVALGEHRLRDLSQPIAVFQVVTAGLRRDFPHLRTLESVPSNLPTQLSSFLGREDDINKIVELLGDARIVTLTGVGGVGKTRLALEVAGELAPRFRHGAWLVELAAVREPDAVPDAVAAALGAPNRPGVPIVEVLTEFLRTKELLLVLDNCEHLLGAATELVRTLERACPELVVLATSREGLGVRGERILAVGSLAESAAVRLFVERASEVQATFDVTEGNEASIGEICRRLDGIPLAVELAAARVAVLNPAELARRLDQRFRVLAGGERGAVERHATLRAAIDWSYDLLAPEEQRMLARLSVFAGGCTLDAAERVCADDTVQAEDVLDLLSRLVLRSLVVADTAGTSTEYRLLETIRQYGEEHLEEQERIETRERHARYYAAWLATALHGAQGPEQVEWFERSDRETENVRAAIGWAVTNGEVRLALELLVTGTFIPLGRRPIAQALYDAAEQVLQLVRDTAADRLTLALSIAAQAADRRGDTERAQQLGDEALATADGADDNDLYMYWPTRLSLEMASGDTERAVEYMERIVAWADRAGTPYEAAATRANLAALRSSGTDLGDPGTDAREALVLARRTGAPSAIAAALAAVALASVDTEPDVARQHLIEAIKSYDSVGYAAADEETISIIVMLAARLGERDATLRNAARVLDRTASSALILCTVLECVAAAAGPGFMAQAATLHGFVDATAPGIVSWGPFMGIRAHANETLSAALGPETVLRLREQGAVMSEPDVVALAGTLIDQTLRN